VLQCVAVCCSVLQCVALCCSVLQCVAVCCSVGDFPIRIASVQVDVQDSFFAISFLTHYNTLQHAATHCNQR